MRGSGENRFNVSLTVRSSGENGFNVSLTVRGSGENRFNVSLTVRGKVTRGCPQFTVFEERGDPEWNRKKVLLLTSLY